jgi:hypothetical protein
MEKMTPHNIAHVYGVPVVMAKMRNIPVIIPLG